jgi:geranylgeranyl diphosphate synthase, type II
MLEAFVSQHTDLDFDFDFDTYLRDRRARLEESLARYFSQGEPALLWEAMAYSVLSAGKRLRAMLVFAAAEAVYKDCPLKNAASELSAIDAVMPLAAAIEMIHAMSLIHDDLPCLDNDDLRRGKPTNHKVYGEAMALLAGDGLLMLATESLIERTDSRVDRQNLLDVTRAMAHATGPSGMVGGQVKDMQFTGAADSNFDIATVESIHAGKTGALIRFALWAPAKLLGAAPEKCESLARLGEIIGLAFQITDDLLDVTGDATTLGKTPGKDEATQKATWVRAIGVDGARAKLKEMEAEGQNLIKQYSLDNIDAPILRSLLSYSIHREK